MRYEKREDRFRVFHLEEGKYTEVEAVTMRNTLFGHLFGPDQAVLVRVEKPTGEDWLEKTRAKLLAIAAMQKGVEGFHPFGSGNGSKQGKFWFAEGKVHKHAGVWFRSAEDAAAYGGILFSENYHGVFRVEGANVQQNPDGADGMGYVDAGWLRDHGLPVRQIQIRAAWPTTLAKGTLLPVEGLAEGAAFLFHPTMLKGAAPSVEGSFLLGIRDVAEERTFRSGWTVTQWFCDEAQPAPLYTAGFHRDQRPAGPGR